MMNKAYQEIVSGLIEQIEKGETLPWRCPWSGGDEPAMPFNLATGKPYRGSNIFLLWAAAQRDHFRSNGWLTFKQAKALDAKIKKGAKGNRCIYFEKVERKREEEQETPSYYMMAKSFVVFNRDQVEGLPEQPIKAHTADQVQHSVEETALPYLEEEEIKLLHGGNRAYYSPAMDLIMMPEGFESGTAYAATLAHEIAHSTGHKSRLNRFGPRACFNRGEEQYAFEELIAELTATLWCSECGASPDRPDHVSYLAHWLKALKNDASFFFKAARQAEQSLQFIKERASQYPTQQEKVA